MENTNSKRHFKNFLKKYDIRVFKLETKYLLVDPENFAFMMFETIASEEHNSTISEQNSASQNTNFSDAKSSIKVVNFAFRTTISSFPTAKRCYFNELSSEDIKYMCDCYMATRSSELFAKSLMDKAEKIKARHGFATRRFAFFIAKNQSHIDIYAIARDIRQATSYLSNNRKWLSVLNSGSETEKKAILRKLLPQKTYEDLRINSFDLCYIDIIINEVIYHV